MPIFEVISIRNIQKINQLGCQTYLPHYPHLWYGGGVEWYLNKCFNEQQLDLDLTNPSLSYYAICVDGQEVGLLKLVKNKAPLGLNPDTSLYLEKIYFLKEFTGLGLGQTTMNWVFEQALNSGIKTVWLMAMDTSHKAIAGYAKAGFHQIGTTRLDEEEFQLMKPEFRGMVILKKDLA
jgi:GNAT superfamily N-acetyltransferase